MKKILILALLFMGCEGFGVFKHEHEGSCVYHNNDWWHCVEETELDCVDRAGWWNNSHGWNYVEMTCDEVCDNIDDGLECEIE